MNAHSPRPRYMVDTNVFVELHTCADLVRDFDELHAQRGDAALDHPTVRYRIARAREAVLLATYFHRVHVATLSLGAEAVAILDRLAPHNVPGGTRMESDFTRTFVWFVKDRVLSGWLPRISLTKRNLKGNAADAEIVRQARIRRIPLISHEGYRPDGTIDEDKLIRRLAREQNVDVVFARELFSGRIDEAAEIEGFLTRFESQAPLYLRKRGIEDEMGAVLAWVHGFYRLILRGEVEGRSSRIEL